MGMGRRENQRADIGKVEPKRQFAAQHAAGLSGAAPGDDLDAAQPVPVCSLQEMAQGVMGLLSGAAVEIEAAGGAQPAGAETLP